MTEVNRMEIEKKKISWNMIIIIIALLIILAFIVNGIITGSYIFDIHHPFGIGVTDSLSVSKDSLLLVKDSTTVVDTLKTITH